MDTEAVLPENDPYLEKIKELENRISRYESLVKTNSNNLMSGYSAKSFFERFGLLFAWAILILAIGFFKPDSMFSWNSYAVMFGSNTMVVLLTVALIIPLTTSDFDLSVASVMGLSSMMIAVLNVNLGFSLSQSLILALICGAGIGALNAFFIIYFGIHSLIVTLGIGYFINGVTLWISNSQSIAGVSMSLVKAVILTRFLGIPICFYYAVILVVFVWYVFQYTSLGRRLLFVGRGREVARLSGVNVEYMRAGALIASSTIAAFAGIIYTGMRGAADPSSATAFLLPAFAAAFLGSTTIYPGRFNAPGAFVAVFFLSTGIMGLNFLGVDSFVQNLFYGGGLVVAVSISQLIRGRQQMD